MNIDAELDRVYAHIDGLLTENKMKEVDRILREIPIEGTITDLLLCYLTVTNPAQEHLPYRAEFREKVERILRLRPEWDERLLQGL